MRRWSALVAHDIEKVDRAPTMSKRVKTSRAPNRSVMTPIGARRVDPVKIGAALSQTAVPSLMAKSRAITRTEGPNITQAANAMRKPRVLRKRRRRGSGAPASLISTPTASRRRLR